MKPLKPWRSFADQLQQLQSRGLQVDSPAAALDYLERLGYYRLSGYWYPLRVIDPVASMAQGKAVRLDSFAPGCRFEDVVQLYVFDKKLRLLALDALERIEMAVRVDVAHLLGQRDPRAHESPACLHGNFTKKRITNGPDAGKTQHQVWLAKYQTLLNRARKEPFVAHHQQQYGAPSGQAFAQWLRSLNFIRNVSAHHSRLWNINVLELSSVPAGWPALLNKAKPFFYFCLMQQLLSVICPNSNWGWRFRSLLTDEFPVVANQTVSLLELGAFPGWEGWALWPQP